MIDIEILEGKKPIPAADRDLENFRSCILDQTEQYPMPVPVISIAQDGEEIPLLTLKGFSLWQGKQKSKKTTVLALTIASFINGPADTDQDTYIKPVLTGNVLWFDTEQGQSYAARTMNLILKLAGKQQSPRLAYCDLREYSPDERLQLILTGIKNTPDLKLVVIDGLVDLMNDFMDAKQGHNLITTILKLCSQFNVHIAGVLHQNKSREDKSARAHVGTIASQKCEVEISAEADTKDMSISKITCLNCRGLPFKDFMIRWEKGSLPAIVENNDQTVQKPGRAYSQGIEVLEAVFKPLTAHTRTEAENAIMNVLKVSESTAKRRMTELINWKMIEKGEDNRYRRVQGSEGFKKGSLSLSKEGSHTPLYIGCEPDPSKEL